MAITVKTMVKTAIPKPATVEKSKSKPAEVGVYTNRKKQVDRLAELIKQANALAEKAKPLNEEAAAIQKELKEFADADLPAVVDAVFKGTEFNFEVSKKQMETTFPDMKDVRKALGDKTFMEVATVTLGDLKKYVTKAQYEALVVESRTGIRKGKLVPTK